MRFLLVALLCALSYAQTVGIRVSGVANDASLNGFYEELGQRNGKPQFLLQSDGNIFFFSWRTENQRDWWFITKSASFSSSDAVLRTSCYSSKENPAKFEGVWYSSTPDGLVLEDNISVVAENIQPDMCENEAWEVCTSCKCKQSHTDSHPNGTYEDSYLDCQNRAISGGWLQFSFRNMGSGRKLCIPDNHCSECDFLSGINSYWSFHSFCNFPGPTTDPTLLPSFCPSNIPTRSPTNSRSPTFHPTSCPSSDPTLRATTLGPTEAPTTEPTMSPTYEPSREPTRSPTVSRSPTFFPSLHPSCEPSYSRSPTSFPSSHPTSTPTVSRPPTSQPSRNPTDNPTSMPSSHPSNHPTSKPTYIPTINPTANPTSRPTVEPTTRIPSLSPIAPDATPRPTEQPTPRPTWNPTTSNPTKKPTERSLPPDFVSFVLESTYVGARASFSSATNKAGFTSAFDCSSVFSGAERFGVGSQCSWIDAFIVRIQFGSLPSLEVSDVVSLDPQSEVLSVDGRSIPASGSVTAEPPLEGFQKPTAVIFGPSTIGLCTNVTLNGETSTGSLGRPLTYQWESIIDDNQANLFIPFILYDANVVSEIDSTLTVTNWVGESNAATFTFSVLNREIPTITFLGPTLITITIDQEVEVGVSVSLRSCEGSNLYRTTYQWSQTSAVDLNFPIQLPSARSLFLSAYQLRPKEEYTFQVTATISGSSSSGSIRIITKFPLPIPRSATQILVSSFEDNTIFLGDLFQVPSGVDSTTEYEFEWSFLATDCDTIVITNANLADIFFPARTFEPSCEYNFQLQLTADGTELLSTALVRTSDRPTTRVFIDALSVGLLNPTGRRSFQALTEVQAAFTFTWQIIDLDANVKTTNVGSQFVIDGGVLDPFPAGASFSIKVSVDDFETGTIGETILGVSINTPPSGGICSSDRSTGSAFDRFMLRCSGWISANSLVYNFRSKGLYLGSWVAANSLEIQLSSGLHVIRGIVRDSLGLEAFSEFTIEVQEATVQAAESYLDNVNDDLSNAVNGSDLSGVAEIALNSKSAAETLQDEKRILEVQGQIVSELSRLEVSSLSNAAAVQTVETLSYVFVSSAISDDAGNEALSLAQSIVDSVSSQDVQSEQTADEKISVAVPVLDLATNLQSSAISSDTGRDVGVEIKRTIQNALFMTIDDRIAGETFEYAPPSTADQAFPDVVSASRLDFSGGEVGTNKIVVPNNVQTEDGSVVDMVVVQSPSSLETTSLNSDQSVAPILSIDFFSQSPGGGRRDLRARESLQVSNLSECNPLVFDIPTNADVESTITSCFFFDTVTGEWSGEGCIAVNQTEEKTTCACTHATSFSAAAKEFQPNIQTLTVEDVRNMDQMFKYPAPLLTVLIVMVVCLLLCWFTPERKSRPILATNEILPKGENRMNLYEQSEQGKMMKILMLEPTFQKVNNLWLFKLRNEHVLFSLFIRHIGTNYSTHQRILGLAVWIYVILLSSALFFGQDQNAILSEVFWTLVVGFIADLPVFFLEYIFRGSRSPNFNPHQIMAESLLEMDKTGEKSGSTASPTPATFEAPLPTSPPNEIVFPPFAGETQGAGPESSLYMESVVSSDADDTTPNPHSETPALADSELEKDLEKAFAGETVASPKELKRSIRQNMNTNRYSMKEQELSSMLVQEDLLTEDWSRLEKKKAYLMLAKHFQLRKGLLRFRYPFRPYWKRVAWIGGITVCIVCSLLVIAYGISFDIEARKEAEAGYLESFESQCELSKSHEEKTNFAKTLEDLNIPPKKPDLHPFSLPDSLSTTERWLISNILAILEGWLFSELILMYITSIWGVAREVASTEKSERPSFSEFFSCRAKTLERRMSTRLRDPSQHELKRVIGRLPEADVEMYTFWNNGLVPHHREIIRSASTHSEAAITQDAEELIE